LRILLIKLAIQFTITPFPNNFSIRIDNRNTSQITWALIFAWKTLNCWPLYSSCCSFFITPIQTRYTVATRATECSVKAILTQIPNGNRLGVWYTNIPKSKKSFGLNLLLHSFYLWVLSDIANCFNYVKYLNGRNYFLFIGDSRIRQVFVSFIKQFDPKFNPKWSNALEEEFAYEIISKRSLQGENNTASFSTARHSSDHDSIYSHPNNFNYTVENMNLQVVNDLIFWIIFLLKPTVWWIGSISFGDRW